MFLISTSRGRFYDLCTVLDGFSRFIVHWDLRSAMTECDIEVILQQHPRARPRIISDNGPQFIARDFKEFIRIAGLTHGRTAPYYPQSNGKIECYYKWLKSECIRPGTPLTPDVLRISCGVLRVRSSGSTDGPLLPLKCFPA
jgi:transposase InsO family protein